jgi:hypothetical protein
MSIPIFVREKDYEGGNEFKLRIRYSWDRKTISLSNFYKVDYTVKVYTKQRAYFKSEYK